MTEEAARGGRDPEYLERDFWYREAAYDAAEALVAFQRQAKDTEPGHFPEERTLVVVTSAPGAAFRARREHSQDLIADMEIAGLLSTSVTLDMVQDGGWLEMCVTKPQVFSGGLSETYFASALNHLHTFLFALRMGFSNLVVLEDDMVLKLKPGCPLALASHIVLNTLRDAEEANYDLLSLDDCAAIHPDPASDAAILTYESIFPGSSSLEGEPGQSYRTPVSIGSSGTSQKAGVPVLMLCRARVCSRRCCTCPCGVRRIGCSTVLRRQLSETPCRRLCSSWSPRCLGRARRRASFRQQWPGAITATSDSE